MKYLRVIDLFTGAGGLTLGFHKAMGDLGIDFEVVASVELDKDSAKTYAKNFSPDNQYVGDIGVWVQSNEIPEADIVIGGPPCQGFSLLNKKTEPDPRNQLWQEYLQVILKSKAKIFVLENVPPFLKSKEFEEFCSLTNEGGLLEGYSIYSQVLDSSRLGAPQKRKRGIIVGYQKYLEEPFEFEECEPRTLQDAFHGIPLEVSGVNLPDNQEFYRTDELHLGRNYTDLSLERFKHIPPGGNRFDIPDELLSPCWRKHKSGAADVMGRLSWDKPSVTIRTEFFKPEKGRYIHPTEDRAITHFEAARLQGFPDDFLWFGSKVSIARQIGNAVPVQMSHKIFLSLFNSIRKVVSDG
jgi:DNA-methyltransferase (dcm)